MPIAYRTIDYGESDPFCPIPASEDDILPSLALSYTRDSDEDNEDARQYVFGIWIYMSSPRELFDIEVNYSNLPRGQPLRLRLELLDCRFEPLPVRQLGHLHPCLTTVGVCLTPAGFLTASPSS